MNWRRVLERNGIQNVDEGVSEPDPFALMADRAHPNKLTEVELEVSRSIELHGQQGAEWVKCGVRLNILCSQNEQAINATGEIAFLKAFELMNKGMGALAPEVPPLVLGAPGGGR